jgi:hypothetical protein
VFYIFSYTGTVAQLQTSHVCTTSLPFFGAIQEPVHAAWVNLTSEITVQHLTAVIPALLSPEVIQADYYFISNSAGTGLSPVWDFRANQKFHGQENAAFVVKRAESVAPPVDPPNSINWLRVVRPFFCFWLESTDC